MPATLSRTAQQNGTQRATKRCQQKQDPSLPYTLAQLSKPKIGHLWPPARSRIHRHQALISPQRFADPDLCRVPDFGSTFGLQELRSPLNEDVQVPLKTLTWSYSPTSVLCRNGTRSQGLATGRFVISQGRSLEGERTFGFPDFPGSGDVLILSRCP
ncbi:LYR motif-containing protein 9 isoform X2 [Hypanus sabinus]|uniref:LYR motif-containing protein 9 isoform X2 n=1 Tax=Hypanus sabinus TaxID=79690 RepID=UPI0028C4D035|nr:LYR motif-containing protein 9 isoform X2 [Hypanus sabinus]